MAKVGDVTTEIEQTEETSESMSKKKNRKVKTVREHFNIEQFGAENPDTVDERGKLTVIPTTWNIKLHKDLKPKDFSTSALYTRWKAEYCRLKASEYTDMSVRLDERADHLEKFGDDANAKKIQKAAAIVNRLAKIREELAASGMSQEELETLFASM